MTQRKERTIRESIEEVALELDNFAGYSKSVASDTAGDVSRLTWQERAWWAASLANTLRGALEAPDER